MQKSQIVWADLAVKAQYSAFVPAFEEQSVGEYHVMMHIESRDDSFTEQMNRLLVAERRLLESQPFDGASIVIKRFILSDVANQKPVIQKLLSESSDCGCHAAVSMIQQAPLDGSKMVVWLYLVKGADVNLQKNVTKVCHNGYHHLFQWGLVELMGDSYHQTQKLLERYESTLESHGATIEANCIRTWFYVRDVDTQYAGLVKARKENFETHGLTEKTHYIASTGIGGIPAEQQAIVQLGSYALIGFEPRQRKFLYGTSHMNPTYEYGVTFERGTVVEYGDRSHLYISGTASINNKGEVMYEGDIKRQTERMIENVEVLLAEGYASFNDVAQMIVYLRDMADYKVVKDIVDRKCPAIPKVFTLAPVCRPTWLIEMECIAITPRKNEKYRNF
ncbi:MAG: Rid family hydrolase [Bacteroidales bacterium]|nr:Rid family hydrolase [Bacteroidales bacterium]